MKLFVSPHNDDAVLFGSFTLQRERPEVLTVFDSYAQVQRGHAACHAEARRIEDVNAMSLLECTNAWGLVRDDLPIEQARPAVHRVLTDWRKYVHEVWLPAVEEGGHEQHNLVGEIGLEVFAGARIHRYLTYTRTHGKSIAGVEVSCNGEMVLMKLRALACYASQISIDALGCVSHFLGDQREYLAP